MAGVRGYETCWLLDQAIPSRKLRDTTEFWAYTSFAHLVQYVEEVIKNFGEKYKVNLAPFDKREK